MRRTTGPGRWKRLSTGRAARRLYVAALLLVPAFIAACTLPAAEDPFGEALTPRDEGVPGLTPPGRSHPHDIHVTADGKKAYIALAGTIARPDDRIAVVDLENGRLRAPIEVGSRPLDIVADPADPTRLFVAHPYSPALSVIDTDRDHVAASVPAPYYLEHLAFTSDGKRLLATDRAQDRLRVYEVTWNGPRPELEPAFPDGPDPPTGPNPEHVVVVPPPPGADWHDRVAAVSDRHGASVTLVDLETGDARRIHIGGPPLALAARDGLLFVAGLGPGDGSPPEADGTPENGTADIENSLLVLDLRAGPDLVHGDGVLPLLRYVSDTARPDGALGTLRILGGAMPRDLQWGQALLPHEEEQGTNVTASLWITFHATDQTQRLEYRAPEAGAGIGPDLLSTRSGAVATRLSHMDDRLALGPGRLTDSVHGLYETPPGPRASAISGDLLLTVSELAELLHVTDLSDCPDATAPTTACTSTSLPLVDDWRPYPDGVFEEGERLFFSAFPSADQDRSCASCHIDGLATGGTWALRHRDWQPVRIPRLDQLADNTPWLLDGSVRTPDDYLNATAGDLLRADPEDPSNLANAPGPGGDNASSDAPYRGAVGRLASLVPTVDEPGDWMRLTFAFAMGEPRTLPVPESLADEMSAKKWREAAKNFRSAGPACVTCHADPREAFMVTPPASERIPKPAGADVIKAPPFLGLWDRTGTGFLYDGRADTIKQAVLPTGHTCLDGAPGQRSPWHGDWENYAGCGTIDQVLLYLLGLEAHD